MEHGTLIFIIFMSVGAKPVKVQLVQYYLRPLEDGIGKKPRNYCGTLLRENTVEMNWA
jgi:hypothetical protein